MKIFLISALVITALVVILFGYVQEVPYFTNTFDIRYLLFRAMGLGGLIGLMVGWFLSKKKQLTTDRLPLILGSIIGCLFVFPLFVLWSNHAFASKDPLSMKVIFEREEPLISARFGITKGSVIKADAYYTYFSKDLENDRIRSKQQVFRGVEPNTEVELPVRKGFWNFQFVDIQ